MRANKRTEISELILHLPVKYVKIEEKGAFKHNYLARTNAKQLRLETTFKIALLLVAAERRPCVFALT